MPKPDPARDLIAMLQGYPGVRHVTATRKELREALLKCDGTMTFQGRIWNIKSKHLAAGVYDVWLEVKNAKA